MNLDLMGYLPSHRLHHAPSEYAFILASIRGITLPRLAIVLGTDRQLGRSVSTSYSTLVDKEAALDVDCVAELAEAIARDLWTNLRHLSVNYTDVKLHLDPDRSTKQAIAAQQHTFSALQSTSSLSSHSSMWRRTTREREDSNEFIFLAVVHCGRLQRTRDVVTTSLAALSHSHRSLHNTNVFISSCEQELKIRSEAELRLDPIYIGGGNELSHALLLALPFHSPGDAVREAPRPNRSSRSSSRQDPLSSARTPQLLTNPPRISGNNTGRTSVVVTQWDIDEFVGRHLPPPSAPRIMPRSANEYDTPVPISATITPDTSANWDAPPPTPIGFHYTHARSSGAASSASSVVRLPTTHTSIRRTATPQWE